MQVILDDIVLRYDVSLPDSEESRDWGEFVRFFEERVGSPLNSLQRYWGWKLFKGLSFSAVAPPGVGKSLFGMVYALFLAERGKRVYVVVPTTTLLRQFAHRFRELGAGEGDLLWFHSGLSKDEKERFWERLGKRRFRILLTTTSFLSRSFERLAHLRFDFIFVDDVDALLKASRNVERVLRLLGFSEEEISSLTPNPRRRHGQLVVSTATAKPGRKAGVFVKLLGFGVGRLRYTVRRIRDLMVRVEDEGERLRALKAIVDRMGYGGLIFVPEQDQALELERVLGGRFRALVSEIDPEEREKIVNDFLDRRIDGLIGVASAYGLLARGIDFPFNIAYAIFYRPPLVDLGPDKGNKRIGDLSTYLQASGRTSRLTRWGITPGVSFLIGRPEELNDFTATSLLYELLPEEVRLEELDWEGLKEELWRARRERKEDFVEVIRPLLMVVESPTKARQLALFFGKPAYNVIGGQIFYETAVNDRVLITTASIGHVVDLKERGGLFGVERDESGRFVPVYGAIKRCRRDKTQFVYGEVCPHCGRKDYDDATDRIRNIRDLARVVGEVLLCSDPDREGEKIAFDVGLFCGDVARISRGEFHEVTRKAVMSAISSLRQIDEHLVSAQVCRRVEDRWIGFSLSGILRRVFKEAHLSAGRTQSPVLHWIVDRTRRFFQRQEVRYLELEGRRVRVDADLPSGELDVEVRVVDRGEAEKAPPGPFSTDLLLREANRLLKLGVPETMRLLQDLFEGGFITYHRTDSQRISDYGYAVARAYLGEDFHYRVWDERPSAHECVRPTRPLDRVSLVQAIKDGTVVSSVRLTPAHLRLYDLIFRRFMASLSPPVRVRWVRYVISFPKGSLELEEAVSVEGKAYELYPWVWKVMPLLSEGVLKAKVISRQEPLAYPFTQAEVIAEMKTKGIGRPSTYALTLERLFLRKYVVERRQKLLATTKGQRVDEFLFSNYESFVSERRTAEMEERIDRVEEALVSPGEVLEDLYQEISRLGIKT